MENKEIHFLQKDILAILNRNDSVQESWKKVQCLLC